jgi:proline iminopeptidase
VINYYPPIKPFTHHKLAVDDIHELYLEESGKEDGLPVLYVHGGPGAGCDEASRCYFDPSVYRIIIFDQRGCGRSSPHGVMQNNTTQHLIEDIEKIRQYLGIKQWVLFGGSWGSTLSLLYAQAYPEKVLGMILRGIFLANDDDIAWFYRQGANRVFPDYWEELLSHLPETARDAPLAAFHERLFGPDELVRMSAAKAWATWEARCATLEPDKKFLHHFIDPASALPFARISIDYLLKHYYLEPEQILSNIEHIQNIPGIIVHGRYDMICAVKNAWQLHYAWPNSQLNIIRDAGHAATEPGIVDALVRATREMSVRLL